MAGNFTDYTERKVLDHIHGVAAFTMPSAVYVALFTANPGEAGVTTNEVSGGGYVRKQITFAAATTDGSNNTTDKNSNTVTFDVATANWGILSHAGIFDAATGGNCLECGPLGTSKTINTGDQFKFDPNTFTEALD